jgi:hypothetical protein
MDKPPKRTRDANERAFYTMQVATGQIPPDPVPVPRPKNPAAVALGKLGASKGGKARAEALSAKRRKQIAKKAAVARWHKPS